MPYTDLGEPRSRNERILMNMLGASYDIEPPQSRIEYLLIEILNSGGTGGAVKGVKGALESVFRTGNVNLKLDEIAGVDNGIFFDDLQNIIRGIQYSVIPAAAATLQGRIIQYTGSDTDTYKNGHFYRCIYKDSAYIWEEALGDTEPLTQEQLDALLALFN